MVEASAEEINDVFDAIVLAEDRLIQSGFQEGFQEGQKDGSAEGFHLGLSKGSELAQELGFYAGFSSAWLHHLQSPPAAHHRTPDIKNKRRVISQLEKLSALLNSAPRQNSNSVDITDIVDDIRSRFKTVCSLLNIKKEQDSDLIAW